MPKKFSVFQTTPDIIYSHATNFMENPSIPPKINVSISSLCFETGENKNKFNIDLGVKGGGRKYKYFRYFFMKFDACEILCPGLSENRNRFLSITPKISNQLIRYFKVFITTLSGMNDKRIGKNWLKMSKICPKWVKLA